MYLDERARDGSVVRATPANLEIYTRLFHAIAENPELGVCFYDIEEEPPVWNVRALSLWGPPMVLELSLGKVCQGQFTYVLPEYRRQGLSKAMYDFGLAELKRRGFTHFAGSVEAGNSPGEASAAHQVVTRGGKLLQQLYVGEL